MVLACAHSARAEKYEGPATRNTGKYTVFQCSRTATQEHRNTELLAQAATHNTVLRAGRNTQHVTTVRGARSATATRLTSDLC